ncbi:MAG: hypothetical protein HYV68_01685, partial [Candidatus Taylorbacteria bacterium]|nr:hypothetical protein [Candidatus Taylorbacteria bacterium]
MWLLSVTPISRGINKERLYYFSSEQFKEGDLIEVPVRSRQIIAKVEEIRSVADAKSELKLLPFAIRKASLLKTARFFSDAFMSAAENSAAYFGCAMGLTLHSLLPPKRLLSALNFDYDAKKDREKTLNGHAAYVLQCADEDRMGTYRRMAREEFAGKRSIIIVLPTIAEAIKTHKEVQKGVEKYAYLLHQRLAKPALARDWQAALTSEHPVIAVTTPQFMGLPRT